MCQGCLQANSDADEVDLLLIVTLLKYICGEGPYQREEEGGLMLGAVLVFLPGALPHTFTAHPTHGSLIDSTLLTSLGTLLITQLMTHSSPYSQLIAHFTACLQLTDSSPYSFLTLLMTHCLPH